MEFNATSLVNGYIYSVVNNNFYISTLASSCGMISERTAPTSTGISEGKHRSFVFSVQDSKIDDAFS